VKKSVTNRFTVACVLFSLVSVPLMVDTVSAADVTNITVHKSQYCGCCEIWMELLEGAGYNVTVSHHEDLESVKESLHVPTHLHSCHTAVVEGYIVEGHVPLEDIDSLLAQRPDAVGIAVPGMPAGAPGTVMRGQQDRYDVILFKANGDEEVFASY
jgi:hypothetical protein